MKNFAMVMPFAPMYKNGYGGFTDRAPLRHNI